MYTYLLKNRANHKKTSINNQDRKLSPCSSPSLKSRSKRE